MQSYLIDLNTPEKEWERSLAMLMRLGQNKGKGTASAATAQNNERLIWNVQKHTGYFRSETHYSFAPRLQKRNKKGWSAGRNIAMKHLFGAPADLDYLDEDDRRICRTIDLSYDYNYSGYSTEAYQVNPKLAWSALVGHPRVFWVDAPATPLDIQRGKEELLTERIGKKIRIKLNPALEDSTEYTRNSDLVIEETPIQLRVYHLTPEILQLHEVLGEKGLVVPPEAETTLRKALEVLAPMITIQSDIQVGDEGNAKAVKADSRLHIHMLP